MTEEDLVRRYPRLFHVTEVGAWESIQVHGLLPASMLLDRLGVTGPERERLEAWPRPHHRRFDDPLLGSVQLQDNRPLQVGPLRRCLDDGLDVADWCRMLNARVFFWADEQGLARLLGARWMRGRVREVLVFATERLLERARGPVETSRINSGAAWMRAARRGLGTFEKLGEGDPRRRVLEVVVHGWVEGPAGCLVERRKVEPRAG